MSEVLQEIVSILVGGIQTLGTGIAQGVTSFAKALFLSGTGTTEDPYKLSVFGGIVAIFGGIALAVGITTLVFNMITKMKA